MNPLMVELDQRSYPIHIGHGLLDRPELVEPTLPSTDVLIVTNETIAPLYLDRLAAGFSGHRVECLVLPDGERFKNLETLNLVFDCLLKHRFSRDCTLIALGGGVIGDITGFAAASYQRGVSFVQVPTTLLSQVDSSVGGKTGVNHALGKNMIGAFHQPLAVIADTSTLDSLADRELRAGISEVIKYSLICDQQFFTWLEQQMDALLNRDASALSYAIRRSCEIKAEIVSDDELEVGKRALLNLGHTFGHAIENSLGYGHWLHGEAVAVGMNIATNLSARCKWLSETQSQRIENLLRKAGLPINLPSGVSSDLLFDLMKLDKKVIGGALRLILLKDLGEAHITSDVDPSMVLQTLNDNSKPR